MDGTTTDRLSREDFLRLSAFITTNFGIKLPEHKVVLLQSRLLKRVRLNGFTNFADYTNFIFSAQGLQERNKLIDYVSTNKTDFFREAKHFDFLAQQIPSMLSKSYSHLKVWSAGCSSGEEPYTIAMTLEELKKTYTGFDYGILGTDISSRILQKASKAVYGMDQMIDVPDYYQKTYFDKGKTNKGAMAFQIKSRLRNKTTFKRLNLMDEFSSLPHHFDFIFCRNVLIYFDFHTQKQILSKFLNKLKPDGILFIGHAESTLGMNLPLTQLMPSVYRKATYIE
ncbi:CheR family methyltransferase [Rapidithrix thailandica]|uniref:protein-glutamate O-methyltransferase n=1 Tax=Rapidithrix thailandica TaxID=413964 RepID=A0AAW9S6E0_9BACT